MKWVSWRDWFWSWVHANMRTKKGYSRVQNGRGRGVHVLLGLCCCCRCRRHRCCRRQTGCLRHWLLLCQRLLLCLLLLRVLLLLLLLLLGFLRRLLLLPRGLQMWSPRQRYARCTCYEQPHKQCVAECEPGTCLPEAAQHSGVALHAGVLCPPLELLCPPLRRERRGGGADGGKSCGYENSCSLRPSRMPDQLK